MGPRPRHGRSPAPGESRPTPPLNARRRRRVPSSWEGGRSRRTAATCEGPRVRPGSSSTFQLLLSWRTRANSLQVDEHMPGLPRPLGRATLESMIDTTLFAAFALAYLVLLVW